MDWKTSNLNIRKRIGIQFFAEESADDGFASGFEGVEVDQLDTTDELMEEAEVETTAEPEESGEENTETPEESSEAPTETTEETPEATVPLVFNGQQISLPESAVRALSGAVGGDVISLIQKGMNYENRGARELGLLDRYAQASGYESRAAYLDAMEQSLGEHQINGELSKLMEQYPDTPADALRPIAERTVKERNAQERAQHERQAQERAQEEMRMAGEEKARPWAEFIRLHPELDPKSMDPAFFKLVNEGIPPVAAYERLEADKVKRENEQLKEQLKAKTKNTQNRQTALGTMASASLDSDPFLAGFGDV